MAALVVSLSSCTAAPQPQQEPKQEEPQPQPQPEPGPEQGQGTRDEGQKQDDETTLKVDVITWDAANVTSTSATLSGSYENATTEVRDHGFYWGTSEDALTGQLALDSNPAKAADFEAELTSLEPGTTYYFRAYVTVWDPSSNSYIDVEGPVSSFTTTGGGDNPPTPPAPEESLQYLGCYEMPAISLKDPSHASGSGKERLGSTNWYNYLTTDDNQMVVSHTYTYYGKTYRNWTALVDKDKKAALWNAFVMHDDAYPDKNYGRYKSWKEDPGIPSSWQSCFSSSGYSRGHMVASNYRQANADANSQTFYYTNQALQYQTSFNDGVWNNLENAVVDHAPSGRDTLYVVVGLLYEDNYKLSGVPVPSHFYKCLMKCSFNTSGEMTSAKGCAYIFTNEAHSNMAYSEGITTIDAIEKRSGFDFYTNVPKELQDAAESSSKSLW